MTPPRRRRGGAAGAAPLSPPEPPPPDPPDPAPPPVRSDPPLSVPADLVAVLSVRGVEPVCAGAAGVAPAGVLPPSGVPVVAPRGAVPAARVVVPAPPVPGVAVVSPLPVAAPVADLPVADAVSGPRAVASLDAGLPAGSRPPEPSAADLSAGCFGVAPVRPSSGFDVSSPPGFAFDPVGVDLLDFATVTCLRFASSRPGRAAFVGSLARTARPLKVR